jgi:HAD superfamily hydrolase (TIGR01509 family)
MIKVVAFDIDGTLVSTKDLHFTTLNAALKKLVDYEISHVDHIRRFDGLSTRQKLEILNKEGKIPYQDRDLMDKIFQLKQELTTEYLKASCKENPYVTEVFKYLSLVKGFKIAVVSNAIRSTVETILNLLNLKQYVSLTVSNEDVSRPKPHPEPYINVLCAFKVGPSEVLVFEDADTGILSAKMAGCNVAAVRDPSDIEIKNVINKLEKYNNGHAFQWECDMMNVLVPMAGAGSRFENAGYSFPKPLIEVNGKPMIKAVVDSLNIKAHYIFITQQAHYEKYNLGHLLNLIAPNCDVIQVNGLTEGAACTSLLAKNLINNDKELIIANSDQLIEWDTSKFFYYVRNKNADGSILTFKNSHPKWSYVKLNEYDDIVQVAEKQVISENATCGIYYWKKGSDYVKYAEQMILKNIRVNNEFYIAPVFNEAIQDGKLIRPFDVQFMHGIGTPEDLNAYLSLNKK